jgi:hypothetical protein
MKKRMLIYITAALLALSGASPWEGAAAVAPEGELPAAGYFVATNSFPRNTVVDITNLETGKSTRAIVANSLNSPGLLAIVSREAAELIGMRRGSVSRIRMVQPSDPIAYLRLTEGIAAGTFDFDSGDVITEETYREDTFVPPVSDAGAKSSVGNATGPSYVLEPEWRTRDVIIDLRGSDEPEQPPVSPSVPGSGGFSGPAAKDEFEDLFSYITEPGFEDDFYDADWYAAEPVTEEKAEEESEYVAEPVIEEKAGEESEYIAEPVFEDELYEDDFYDEEDEYIAEPVVEEEEAYVAEPPPEMEHKEYVLVTAEERPPEYTIYGINPADILPPDTPANTGAAVVSSPVVSEPESRAPVVPDTAFSVRSITELDRGWYYVQIGSFDSPHLIESALREYSAVDVNHSYQPVIYNDGAVSYRLLLGPMNQGESAAVLQRFKSVGYRDAFVRYAR